MSDPTLYAKINQDAALIDWNELQRHFARGRLLCVSEELDLIAVGAAMAEDNVAELAPWVEREALRQANEQDARHWHETSAVLWAVVIAPWVLVQGQARLHKPSGEQA
ncbi:MAG: hypothetical protein RIQ52_882 [Pseudomonadota bacterium]|jgi:hypothetical protein